MRRILTNLLANALTYTAEGGIVRADVRFEEGAGIVTLSDSGGGFSRAERAGPAGLSSASTAPAPSPARAWALPSPWSWRGAWAGPCA